MRSYMDYQNQLMAHEIFRHQLALFQDPYLMPIAAPVHHYQQHASMTGVNVELQNKDLWKTFHDLGNEMIITKTGRRMFPAIRVSLSGLEDNEYYIVLLEMVPVGEHRYKYSGSQWVPAGGAEPQNSQRIFIHSEEPMLGSQLSAQPVLFNKAKLTNDMNDQQHIVLTSMHKYQPYVHVIRSNNRSNLSWAPRKVFLIPDTEFIAVTAYQNDRITTLKIENNPFAKGFRKDGQSRCKRKLVQSASSQSPSHTDSTEEDNDPDTEMKRLRGISDSDDSGLSVGGHSSRTCSPSTPEEATANLNAAHALQHRHHQHQPNLANYSPQPPLRSYPPYMPHPNIEAALMLSQNPHWFSQANSPHLPTQYHPSLYQQNPMRMLTSGSYSPPNPSSSSSRYVEPGYPIVIPNGVPSTHSSLCSPTTSDHSQSSVGSTSSGINQPSKPASKRCGFSIDDILS